MKKIVLVLLFTVSNVFAQEPVAPAPAPVEPVLAPQAAPSKETAVTTQSGSNASNLNRVDPASFNARLGVGAAFGPSALWITGDVDVQLDKFVAIGPKIQYGTNSSTDFMFGSVGPRFTIPFSFFEIGLGTGFGFAYRNVAGFEFTNFLYNVGLNFDVFLFESLSVGVGYNANFTSAAADGFISSLAATAAVHF
jgi:hypothetical protein